MAFTSKDHIFAVCAYGESAYLEECIASLEGQIQRSRIILCTATPSTFLDAVAKRHGIELFVNRGPHGIAEDWNFAYSRADAPLVTLAHQDDVYDPAYLKRVLESMNRERKPLITFSDYYELRNGEKVHADRNRNLRIKELVMLPLRIRAAQRSRWIRRRILSLCDPICCPSVTYVKDNLPQVMFEAHFSSDLDWQAWERISRLKGSFCYLHEPLMGHRIHEESTTTKVIGANKGRSNEDLEMYMKFWPKPIAVLINRLYSAGQDANDM